MERDEKILRRRRGVEAARDGAVIGAVGDGVPGDADDHVRGRGKGAKAGKVGDEGNDGDRKTSEVEE